MELHSLQEDTDIHKDLGRKQRCQETKTNQLPAGSAAAPKLGSAKSGHNRCNGTISVS